MHKLGMVLTLAVFLHLCCDVQISFSKDSSPEATYCSKENWYIGPRVGYSPFTGVVGVEMQKQCFALTLGVPERIGVKYYFTWPRHSWFIGSYVSQYEFDHDETHDGIVYHEETNTEIGIGGGYRWRWGSGWDLALSLAVAYGEEELTNAQYKRTTEYIGLRPGIAVGYSF